MSEMYSHLRFERESEVKLLRFLELNDQMVTTDEISSL